MLALAVVPLGCSAPVAVDSDCGGVGYAASLGLPVHDGPGLVSIRCVDGMPRPGYDAIAMRDISECRFDALVRDSIPDDQRDVVIAHEIGHLLGLGHAHRADRVMTQSKGRGGGPYHFTGAELDDAWRGTAPVVRCDE